MIRRAPALAAPALALLLSACAAPQGGPGTAAAPAPATRFEPGGGPVTEVDLSDDLAGRIEGVWVGAYRPWDPTTESYAGPVAGTARLEVAPRGGRLADARMSWNDGALGPVSGLGALTVSGHVMLFNAHFIAFRQDGVTFIEADMMLPDGRFHRHRLVRESG